MTAGRRPQDQCSTVCKSGWSVPLIRPHCWASELNPVRRVFLSPLPVKPCSAFKAWPRCCLAHKGNGMDFPALGWGRECLHLCPAAQPRCATFALCSPAVFSSPTGLLRTEILCVRLCGAYTFPLSRQVPQRSRYPTAQDGLSTERAQTPHASLLQLLYSISALLSTYFLSTFRKQEQWGIRRRFWTWLCPHNLGLVVNHLDFGFFFF